MHSAPLSRLVRVAAILVLDWYGSDAVAAPSLYAVTQSYGVAVTDIIDRADLRFTSINTVSIASSPSYTVYKGLPLGPDGLLYAATQSYSAAVLDIIDPDSFRIRSRNAVTVASRPRSTTYTRLAFAPGGLLYGVTQTHIGTAELDVIDPATLGARMFGIITFASDPNYVRYNGLAFRDENDGTAVLEPAAGATTGAWLHDLAATRARAVAAACRFRADCGDITRGDIKRS